MTVSTPLRSQVRLPAVGSLAELMPSLNAFLERLGNGGVPMAGLQLKTFASTPAAAAPAANAPTVVLVDTGTGPVFYVWNGSAWVAMTTLALPGVHVLATTAGMGPQHSVSGLTSGQVLAADSATVARFRTVDVSEITGSLPASRLGGLTAHAAFVVDGAGAARFLAPSTAGKVMRSDGTDWQSTQLAFSDLSGSASVAQGGTGVGALTAHAAVVVNAGGTAIAFVSPGAAGHVLRSNGTDYVDAQLAYSDLSGIVSPGIQAHPQPASDVTVPAGATAVVEDYYEIPAGQMLELSVDSVLEILPSAGAQALDAPAFRAYPMVTNQYVPDGSYAAVADVLEIPAGFVLELGVNALLEILPSDATFIEIGL